MFSVKLYPKKIRELFSKKTYLARHITKPSVVGAEALNGRIKLGILPISNLLPP